MMKKIIQRILVAVIVAFATAGANAQSHFSLGPKIILSSTTFSGSDVDTTIVKNKIGFGAGIYMAISPAEWLTIQPELLYNVKGAKFVVGDYSLDYAINYFDVPLLVKLKLPLGGAVYPFVMGGPDFNFLLSADFVTTDQTGKTTTTTAESSNLKKTDIGYVFGAGVDIQLGNLYLSGDLRYAKSMSTIFNADQTQSQNTYNSSVGFGIGIGLIIGGKK